MLIPVRSAGGEVLEWALIELQGKLEQQPGFTDQPISDIGTLVSTSANGDSLQLTIGYHQMDGKRVPLKKPFAIMRKKVEQQAAAVAAAGEPSSGQQQQQDGAHTDGDAAVVAAAGAAPAAASTSYEVIGVIRHKYLFKTRPRPLISKPASNNNKVPKEQRETAAAAAAPQQQPPAVAAHQTEAAVA